MRCVMKPREGLTDDTQGFLWPSCHHSENEANPVDRTELREEERNSCTQDSRPKSIPSRIHRNLWIILSPCWTQLHLGLLLHEVQSLLRRFSSSPGFSTGWLEVGYWISLNLSFLIGKSFPIDKCEDLMRKKRTKTYCILCGLLLQRMAHPKNQDYPWTIFKKLCTCGKDNYPELLEL